MRVVTETKESVSSSLWVTDFIVAPLTAFRSRSSRCSAVWLCQCTCHTKTKNQFPRARSKPSSRHQRRTFAAQVSIIAPGLGSGSYKTKGFSSRNASFAHRSKVERNRLPTVCPDWKDKVPSVELAADHFRPMGPGYNHWLSTGAKIHSLAVSPTK